MRCVSNCDWTPGCSHQRDCRRHPRQLAEAGELSSHDEAGGHLAAAAAASNGRYLRRRRQGNPPRRRGYRLFYRPVSVRRNYYALPFPPPETLRLAADVSPATAAAAGALGDDGDSRCADGDGNGDVWQDLEIRVISHDGVVLWQDLQTRSDSDAERSGWRQPHRRKFAPRKRRQRRRSPPLPHPRRQATEERQGSASESAVSSKSESPTALVSIEAVISIREASPSHQKPPPLQPQRTAVSNTNEVGLLRSRPGNCSESAGCESGVSNRLDEQVLWKMRQMQHLQELRMMLQQQQQLQQGHPNRYQSSPPALNSWQRVNSRLQPPLLNQPLRQAPSLIPRPINSRPRVPQPQRLSRTDAPEFPANQAKQLTVNQSGHAKPVSGAAAAADHPCQLAATDLNRAARSKQKLPSYMRPYSPMLQYPQPSRRQPESLRAGQQRSRLSRPWQRVARPPLV